MANRHSQNGYPDLEFDILKIVQSKRSAHTGTKNAEAKSDRPTGYEGGCFAYVFGVGLAFAAALWDLYYRTLRLCRIVFFIEIVEALDLLLKVLLVILAIVQFTEYWVVQGSRSVEIDLLASTYWAVVVLGILLYLSERLVGRYFRDAPSPMESVEDLLPLQMVNRAKFSGPASAIIVTIFHLFVAVCVLMVLLVHLTRLQSGPDGIAFANITMFTITNVVYVFARLPRFKEIVEQSWESAHVAGAHTFWVICVELPFAVVLCVHSALQPVTRD